MEHFVAWKLLDLKEGIYIDVAACNSPWVHILRNTHPEIEAFAIDLEIPEDYRKMKYYIRQDATKTSFDDNSVDGVSLQCAYEMFVGEDDINLIIELGRILKSEGKAVILPLYMHTHPCHYSTPEYYGKGFGDRDSKEYIRWDCWGIKASRKYSVEKLKNRILSKIEEVGMNYKIYVLKNKRDISENIYLHFILLIEKP